MSLAIVFSAVLVTAMAYIRLAAVDVSVWHRPLSVADQPTQGVQSVAGGVLVVAVFEASTVAQVLARLDGFALITPRTRRIAGSPQAGLITWETRSAFWGFPDYATAQATEAGGGTTLRLFARQRFGSEDFGVNAARLTGWMHLLRADSAPADGVSQ